MPSHLVSAETGFPQGAAQNGPPSQLLSSSQQQAVTENSQQTDDDHQITVEGATNAQHQPVIEGMTREEGDGEGDKDLSPETQWGRPLAALYVNGVWIIHGARTNCA